VIVPTFDNGQVADDKVLTVGLQPGPGYIVGNPSVAASVIVNSTLPKLSILGGGGSVPAGGGAVFTIAADQPPVEDIWCTRCSAPHSRGDISPVTGSAIMPAGPLVEVTI
jgi:hypothetical protein